MKFIDKISCDILAKAGDFTAIRKIKIRNHRFVVSRGVPAELMHKLTHSPACVFKYDDNKSYIFISSKINIEDRTLNNFVIFHEMGHVFYDKLRKSEKRSIHEECMADSFALKMGMAKEEALLSLEKIALMYSWTKELKARYKYISKY